MTNNRSNQGGCAGWFKWIVGSFIALLGASGGLAAWFGVFRSAEPPPAPQPIVITVNPGGEGSAAAPAVVELPDDVFVPQSVPTPLPIVNEPNSNRPSEQDVANFLYEAVLAETAAYLYLDSSYISWYFAGAPLTYMESEIADLITNGVIVAKYYDETQSYIYDIHYIDEYRIEVDSCEVWSQEMYSVWDSSFLGSDGPSLYPQTIVIEQFTDGWYITDALFYDVPAFCN